MGSNLLKNGSNCVLYGIGIADQPNTKNNTYFPMFCCRYRKLR